MQKKIWESDRDAMGTVRLNNDYDGDDRSEIEFERKAIG